MEPLAGKRILLIVGGGIAAYKAHELIRQIRTGGGSVRCILTRAGREFVTPLSLGSLSGDKVYGDLFDLTDEAEMGHIRLSRDADLVVVAPATADLIAKMATGHADDLASTTLLATDKPVLMAPAMNVRMWLNPATVRNVSTLRDDGAHFVGPNDGDMACGEFGPGRMAEPSEIIAAVEAFFESQAAWRPLDGLHALVTSGPTHEPIDPVRYIANRSSGKQGHAIAAVMARLGAETTLISGPTALSAPLGVTVVPVETAQQMLAACENALPVDVAVLAAAVADWRVANNANQKIKKSAGTGKPDLQFVENPDILQTLSNLNGTRPRLVIGFAAETENVLAYAEAKRKRKGCDWMVANDVSPATGIMGGNTNTVHLITDEGSESWETMDKTAVAERLARRIADHFAAAAPEDPQAIGHG